MTESRMSPIPARRAASLAGVAVAVLAVGKVSSFTRTGTHVVFDMAGFVTE